MMILVIGGAYQGKGEFAQSIGIDPARIIYNAQDLIARAVKDGRDAERELFTLLDSGDYDAVTCDEIGMGIVPAERAERERRELTGRIMCRAAKAADAVYRVQCGIGIRIK